jgi:hypothetical protein
VFLTREQLSKAVGRHLSSGFPLNSNPSSFHLLAEPHLININIAKLCLNAICVAFHKAYSLSVVTPKSLLSVKRKANIAAELIQLKD